MRLVPPLLIVLLSCSLATTALGARSDVDPLGTSTEGDESQQTESPKNPAQVAPERETKESYWYGAPIIGFDIAALGLGTIAVSCALSTSDDTSRFAAPAAIGAGLMYTLGGPLVHVANDRLDMAGASLLTRLVLPLPGALVGMFVGIYASQGCRGEFCELEGAGEGMGVGFLLGAAAASVIDVTDFAYKQAPETTAFRLVPTGDVQRKAVGLSLQGTW
jgi:hypothetical protein